jgi:hypothetical protein
MKKYIHFTDEQKRQANAVDLEQFLLQRGERLIPSGREKRLARDHSVTVRGNEWYDHAAERGGGAISFVQTFYRLPYPQAVSLLLSGSNGLAPVLSDTPAPEPKAFALPPAASNMRRVFAYLTKTRGIDQAVVSAFAHAKLIYEDAQYHNAVFVGMDRNGTPRHAHKRSTNSEGKSFRQTIEGSDFHCAFHWLGGSDELYVFEAPIDLLSYITLNPDGWQRHNYVACCGTSALPVLGALEQASQIQTVHFCLDSDNAGLSASRRLAELVASKGLDADLIVPTRKDWNEDLLAERDLSKNLELTAGYSM